MEAKSRLIILFGFLLIICLVYLITSEEFIGKANGFYFDRTGEIVRMAKYPNVKSIGEEIDGIEKQKNDKNRLKWLNIQEDIQRERLSLLKQECKMIPHDTEDEFVQRNPTSFIIDKNHQLLHCRVPKIASTSWKHMFLILGGYLKPNQHMNQNKLNHYGGKVLPRLTDLSIKQRRNALHSYKTFVFVRHPFSRIISVFRNKISPNTTFERALHWQHGMGMNIIKQYRGIKEIRWIKKNFKKNYNLKFGEFVKYIGDPQLKPTNGHWNEIYRTCHPCAISFDFIGKMETMTDDINYIMKILHLDKKYTFPSSALSSPTNSTPKETIQSYFKDIPVEDLKNLYKRFELDFKLFGYPKPDFVNGKIFPD